VPEEVGLGLLSSGARAEFESIARQAERSGLDVLSVYHDLLHPPALVPLLWMARVTERIVLGPAALNPFTLHPYEIAGQIAALDADSGGRAYLGLAKGAWLDRLGLAEERPLAALAEAVTVVSRLLAGDDSGFAGERFSLAPGVSLAYGRARGKVPLAIGTWGRRTASWAGTVADEIKVGGTANPELVQVVRGWVGNDAVRLVVGSVCVVDEDGAWARRRAAEAAAGYIDVVARLDPTLAGADPPPVDRFVLAGTPHEVAERVRELWAAGADRVELGTPQGRTRLAGVDLICSRVLPLLR
jgi:5,10-methylenetetrahydromethanopterin reductase